MIALLVGVEGAMLADAFMIALVVITFYMKSIATVMVYVNSRLSSLFLRDWCHRFARAGNG